MTKQIRIGTRGSRLALWQAEYIKSEIEKLNPEYNLTITTIKTKGDIITDVPLAKIGGKGLFVKEIELEPKSDVLVCDRSLLDIYAYYFAKFGRHDFFHKILTIMEKLTFKTADIVISTNESYKKIAIGRGGMDAREVFVVRNGNYEDIAVCDILWAERL